ncbi:MAG: hypothetical protein E6G10_07650 [Actinobacteria bacterium]|nr:MAG: hypothetical protein E6G10_07650 [Actinomycetota bacterium]
MATVYGLSREGGPRSRRFDAYLRLVRDHEGAGCRYAAELAAQWVAELGPARALRRSPGDLATPPPARAASCSR